MNIEIKLLKRDIEAKTIDISWTISRWSAPLNKYEDSINFEIRSSSFLANQQNEWTNISENISTIINSNGLSGTTKIKLSDSGIFDIRSVVNYASQNVIKYSNTIERIYLAQKPAKPTFVRAVRANFDQILVAFFVQNSTEYAPISKYEVFCQNKDKPNNSVLLTNGVSIEINPGQPHLARILISHIPDLINIQNITFKVRVSDSYDYYSEFSEESNSLVLESFPPPVGIPESDLKWKDLDELTEEWKIPPDNERTVLDNFFNLYNFRVVKTDDPIYKYRAWFFGYSTTLYNEGLLTPPIDQDLVAEPFGNNVNDCIFYARSKSLTSGWEVYSFGDTWDMTMNPSLWKPVITRTPVDANTGIYEGVAAGDPSVVYVNRNQTFYMAYSAVGRTVINNEIRYVKTIMGAKSTDGINWTKSSLPILEWPLETSIGNDPSNPFRSNYYGGYHRPTILRDENKWKMWFDYYTPDANKYLCLGYAENDDFGGDSFLNGNLRTSNEIEPGESQWRVIRADQNPVLENWPNPDVIKIYNKYYSFSDSATYGPPSLPGENFIDGGGDLRLIVQAESNDGINWVKTGFIRPEGDDPAHVPQAYNEFVDGENSLFLFYSWKPETWDPNNPSVPPDPNYKKTKFIRKAIPQTYNPVPSNDLFDKSSWQDQNYPELLVKYLDIAADSWRRVVKFDPNVLAAIRQYINPNFMGLILDSIEFRDDPTGGWAAACGPKTYIDIYNRNDVKFNTYEFRLLVNTAELSFENNLNPKLVDIFIHELGHALGIGIYWTYDQRVDNPQPPVWYYRPWHFLKGEAYPNAMKAYNDKFKFRQPRSHIPINWTGIGEDGHWADIRNTTTKFTTYHPVIEDDIMSYYRFYTIEKPITNLSIKWLEDIGYSPTGVDFSSTLPLYADDNTKNYSLKCKQNDTFIVPTDKIASIRNNGKTVELL